MATNVNRTELIGNLGDEPQRRINPAGTLIVTASIAVHSSFKQDEEWQNRTDWFRLVAFGEAGENLSRFAKGERIAVLGRLQTSSYTDREGIKRTSVELVVLRSEDAPLGRKAQAAPVAAPAPVEEPTPEVEPVAEPVAPKARRRRTKVAA